MKTTCTNRITNSTISFSKAAFLLLFACITSLSSNAQLVINQIYAGGGTAGATYNASYVQLINQSGKKAYSLDKVSLQFSKGKGNDWESISLPNVELAPGQIYVIAGTKDLINGKSFQADLSNTNLKLVPSGGVVAIKKDLKVLTTCPDSDNTVIEYVGWGNATCYDQKSLENASNTKAFYRKSETSSVSGTNFSRFDVAIPNPAISLSAATLPIRLYDFSGLTTKQGNQLKWKASVTGTSGFQVERSENGINFTAIASLRNSVIGDEQYSYTDAGANAPTNYYRLRMTDETGVYSYSSIVKLNSKGQGAEATLYPTMASSQVTLAINANATQKITYQIFSMEGRAVVNGTLSVSPGMQTATLSINNLQKGSYMVQLQRPNGQFQTLTFIKG